MTKAIVIRTTGDPEIAGAIVEGMTRRVIPLDTDELSAVKAELARYKDRHELRAYGDEKRFSEARDALARKYSSTPHGRAYDAILGVWGLLWYSVGAVYEYMSAWNRR